jgi:hypothetical protein
MDLIIGETYNSPIYGRYIQVLDIKEEDSERVELELYWVDKDTFETELSYLKVRKSDLESWTKVKI